MNDQPLQGRRRAIKQETNWQKEEREHAVKQEKKRRIVKTRKNYNGSQTE